MLSGWKPDSQYVLEVQRTLAREVFDGQSSYAAGSYDYKLVLAAARPSGAVVNANSDFTISAELANRVLGWLGCSIKPPSVR